MGIWDNFFEKAKSIFGEKDGEKRKPCYYELLELDRNATDDEIKRSYKRLALKWHPDKNPERLEECTAYFVLLQQAYEVLSDPQERAFYDKHRENIIYGGQCGPDEKRDTGINLLPYFERSCFQGFGDDENGFYAVYRDVFHKISAEEYDYIEEMDERNFPVFGSSTSDYKMIVDSFYGFWMDFSTRRSFAWLDQYDLKQAGDRQTLRLMEKENKRLRDAGRKQRSDEIQRLVMHIRKLDKRVKRYRDELESRKKEQLKRVEEQQRQMIRRNLENLEEYTIDEAAQQEHLRNLEEIENQLDSEFGTFRLGGRNEDNNDAEATENSDVDDDDDKYCVVCEKAFKTQKSYFNHVKSKKHKQAVELLRKHMKDEDKVLLAELETNKDCANGDGNNDGEDGGRCNKRKKNKGRKAANRSGDSAVVVNEEHWNTTAIMNDEGGVGGSEKRPSETAAEEERRKESHTHSDDENCPQIDVVLANRKEDADFKQKKEKSKKKNRNQTMKPQTEKSKETNTSGPIASLCQTCGQQFESKTKLFQHLRESGHATLKAVNDWASGGAASAKNKQRKGKKA